MCETCGKIGCCDSSPNKHASRARARGRAPDRPLRRARRDVELVLRRRGRVRDRRGLTLSRARSSAANASGRTPVVFVHGLWLLPSSWDRWAEVFEEAGYAPLTPGWPDDPETVEEANAHPEVFAGKTVGQIADHVADVIGRLDEEAGGHRPLVRRPADADPRRPRARGRVGRDRPGAVPRRAAAADLRAASRRRRCWQPGQPQPGRAADLRPVPLRASPTRSSEDEAQGAVRDATRCPAPGAPLFQAATANLNPWTEVKVDTKNPDRGPLLIISGEKDHTVPWAIANASYKKQKRNAGVTEIVEIPGRGHSLDDRQRLARGRRHGARFVQRFA